MVQFGGAGSPPEGFRAAILGEEVVTIRFLRKSPCRVEPDFKLRIYAKYTALSRAKA